MAIAAKELRPVPADTFGVRLAIVRTALGGWNVKRAAEFWFSLVGLVAMVLTLGFAGIIIWPVAMVWAATDAGRRHSAYEAWLHRRTADA